MYLVHCKLHKYAVIRYILDTLRLLQVTVMSVIVQIKFCSAIGDVVLMQCNESKSFFHIW